MHNLIENTKEKSISFVNSKEKLGDDRTKNFTFKSAHVILLSDGAGGFIGASEASDYFINYCEQYIRNEKIDNSDDLELLLRNIDLAIFKSPVAGETTGIIIFIKNNTVIGASVGDSESWLFNENFKLELTSFQYNKPLLGSGNAIPIGFGPFHSKGILLVGSDGLFDYTSIDNISNVLLNNHFINIPQKLLSLIKLNTGRLQDDFSVVLYTKIL